MAPDQRPALQRLAETHPIVGTVANGRALSVDIAAERHDVRVRQSVRFGSRAQTFDAAPGGVVEFTCRPGYNPALAVLALVRLTRDPWSAIVLERANDDS